MNTPDQSPTGEPFRMEFPVRLDGEVYRVSGEIIVESVWKAQCPFCDSGERHLFLVMHGPTPRFQCILCKHHLLVVPSLHDVMRIVRNHYSSQSQHRSAYALHLNSCGSVLQTLGRKNKSVPFFPLIEPGPFSPDS